MVPIEQGDCNDPKFSGRQDWVNSVDPDQIHPSALFGHIILWLNHSQILE